MKRAIALEIESTWRDGVSQGYATPRPKGAPLTDPAPPPKNDRLRGRCPPEDIPGSLGPSPLSSHSNWTILWGQVMCTEPPSRPKLIRTRVRVPHGLASFVRHGWLDQPRMGGGSELPALRPRLEVDVVTI